MAAVVVFTLAFLICQANSQIIGLGPTSPILRRFEPATPSAAEVYRPSIPLSIDSYNVQTIPELVSVSQPTTNTVQANRPSFNAPAPKILNLPVPPNIQNLVPTYNQPTINIPDQAIVSNLLPIYPNTYSSPISTNTPQLAPPIIGNTAAPVVTVVDSTLASSLANALQLLILSNILENSGSCNSAQNLPCITNYEIVTPDFTVPSISCDYVSNVAYPEPIVPIPEPVFASEPVLTSPEPVFTCQETIVPPPEPICSCPEPVIFQSYPTNVGGYPFIDNSGFKYPNQVCFETPQYVAQVAPAPACELAPIPAVATIPPMALEVPFPASIPAQLICNFGMSPSNQPCVSFNVEPLPCNNIFSSFGNFRLLQIPNEFGINKIC